MRKDGYRTAHEYLMRFGFENTLCLDGLETYSSISFFDATLSCLGHLIVF